MCKRTSFAQVYELSQSHCGLTLQIISQGQADNDTTFETSYQLLTSSINTSIIE